MEASKPGKSILRPFDGVAFDTPENHVRFAGQSGWLAFYTAIKMVTALFLFAAFSFETLNRFATNDNKFFLWPDFGMQMLIALVVMIVFFALERTAFSGFRAYLDAHKRVALLEESLKASNPVPIYSPVYADEKAVPTSRSRFQLFLFVWSKYLFFLIYAGMIGLSLLVFFAEGTEEMTTPFMFFAILCGPLVLIFLGKWVLQSEKEIRLSFARNGSIDAELRTLQARNAELEASMSGFTGQTEERDADWQNQLRAKAEALRQKEAELEDANQRVAALEVELKDTKEVLDEMGRDFVAGQAAQKANRTAYEKLQGELNAVTKRLANVSTEFAKNCTLDEAFSSVKQSLERLGSSDTLDSESLTILSELMREVRAKAPDGFSDAKSLSFVSAEEQRINQYDAIVRLYSRKIQKLRSSELDEEEQQDAIDAMRRLRDREIAELEGST